MQLKLCPNTPVVGTEKLNCTTFQMHEHRLLKMGMDDLLEFLQQTLENNFGYDDDRVIEELRQNLKELRESRLTTSGKRRGTYYAKYYGPWSWWKKWEKMNGK